MALDSGLISFEIVNLGNCSNFVFTGNTSPPVVLVGHSMGGALAVHTALQNYSSLATTEESERSPQNYDDAVTIQNLVGVCVIDVVEGTAMDALSSMQSFLRSRPKSFPSLGTILFHKHE